MISTELINEIRKDCQEGGCSIDDVLMFRELSVEEEKQVKDAIAAMERQVPQPDANGEFATPADGAKFMASMGIPQIPLRPRLKAPIANDWPELATTDFNQIDRWTVEYPNCNFGSVAFGCADGVGIFEVDSAAVRGRYSSETHEDFAETFTVISTQNDSENVHKGHRYYRHTTASIALGNVKQDDENQFSFRGNRQFCVSPGSFHPKTGRQYRVCLGYGLKLAPIPDTMVAWLQRYKALQTKDSSAKSAAVESAPVAEGGRNTFLTSVCGKWRAAAVPPEEIRAGLHKLNQEKCVPPLADSEVDTIVDSVLRYPEGQPAPVYSSAQPSPQNIPMTPPAETPEWPNPIPYDSSMSEVPPFKLDFLPTAVRAWVSDLAERMGVPLDFPGIACLVTMAGCMNRRVFVYPKALDKSWREAVSISGAVLASSGEKKTPVWKQFTNPLVEIELESKRQHDDQVVAYKRLHAEWDARQKEAKRDKKPFEEPEPQEPCPARRLILNNATPEALHTAMSHNPQGVFVYRDELSGWVAELEKDGYESQKEVFLCALTGDDAYGMERVGRGTVFARMSASMFGGIQPRLFIEFLNAHGGANIASGLIPRFGLLVFPDILESEVIDRSENMVAKESFRRIVRALAAMPPESLLLNFNDDAQQKFNDWHKAWLSKVRNESSEAKQSHLNKYVGLVVKLAGLGQVVDNLSQTLNDKNGVISGAYRIDLTHLDQALGLAEYLESHLNRIYGCVKTEGQKAEAALAEHLLAGDLEDGFAIRTITNRKQWSLLKDARTVEYCLQTFEELGWIRALPEGPKAAGGRPTVRYEINPKLPNLGATRTAA